jgi:hypothetical protein
LIGAGRDYKASPARNSGIARYTNAGLSSSYAILGEGASRAMLYVAMTRGRHNNEVFLYQSFTKEADHDHTASAAENELHFCTGATNTQPHNTSARS